MADTLDARKAWIERVLGVRLEDASGGTTKAPPSDIAGAIAAWTDAIERTNAQIDALQAVLREAPDDDLRDIAEFGLNGVTGNHRVKMQAALMALEAGGANPNARRKTVALIGTFLEHITSDEGVAACDANPFGVTVSVRRTLVPSPERLRAALSATG